jgi:hypothetical protein
MTAHRSIRLSIIVGLIFCLAVTARPARGKEFRVMVPRMKGAGDEAFKSFFTAIEKGIFDTSGLRIKIQEYQVAAGTDFPSRKILDLMNKNQLDFGLVFPQDYIRYLMTQPSNAMPALTITFFGKPASQVCAFTRKDDNISSLEQLRGKVWGGSNFVASNYLLYKRGFDMPLNRFFSRITYIPSIPQTHIYDELLSKKIDVFVDMDSGFKIIKNSKPTYKNIRAAACLEFDHNWILVYRKGLPEKDVKNLKGVLLTAHVNKAFASLKFLFTMVQGHFVEVDLKNLKTTKEIVDLAISKGWYTEEQKFYKANANTK